MSSIETYIQGMKLKKAVGGFDKESVYTSMQELSALYQKDINNLKKDKEQLETELKRLSDEREQTDKEMMLLKFQLEEEQKHRNEYDDRMNALTQATETVRGTREKLLEEARKDAEEIYAEAEEKASETLATANQRATEIISKANERAENARHECFIQKQQKDQIVAKIAEAKQQYSDSMIKIRSGLSEILTELDDLQVEESARPIVKSETEAKPEEEVVRTVIYERPNRLVRKVTGCVSDYDRQ